ncbi:MAG: right-handed parallel beta-helix repeat-containing protein [Candidatus Heimdallarchaeota archaeon]|nr:right-handed parallel beta-helix repeat-containing protein [Candidatus Heimdallarchaeota archaeon]MCK5048967.1 right-handed parallel beta-helix repeat-containing protein [Candidatus Heimdallarchaeota archaeon]
MSHKLFTLLFTLLLISTFNVSTSGETNVSNQVTFSLFTSEPVEILNDTALASYSTFGSGTPLDPYILEGFNISTTAEVGLTIKGTTKHFVLQNSWITTGGFIGYQVFDAIILDEIASGTAIIRNNSCYNARSGIHVRATDNITLVGNKCYDNYDSGIYSYSATNVSMIDNILHHNWKALYISQSDDAFILNNNLFNNTYGLELDHSHFSKILNNTCVDNLLEGFDISSSLNTEVYGNYLRNEDDINIQYSDNSAIYSNTLEGTITGLFISDATISVFNNSFSNHELFSIGLETAVNSVIKNNTMTRGITISDDSLNVDYHYIITNNTVNDLPIGYFENETDLTIEGDYAQIIVVRSTNITVRNGNYTDVSNGISFYYSNNSFIVNNHCNNSFIGINVLSSNNMTITDNVCANNYGGIIIFYSHNNTIHNNLIIDGTAGLMIFNLVETQETKISNNTLVGNGIRLLDFTSHYENFLFENNTVNGLPYGYFINATDEVIDEKYGQMFFDDAYNITIKNQDFRKQAIAISMMIGELIEIVNCTFSDISIQAIFPFSINQLSLWNNTFERNGICFSTLSSAGLIIDNNIFHQNDVAIDAWAASSTITNNQFIENSMAVELSYSHYSLIANNVFINNNHGVMVEDSNNVTIENNEFAHNKLGISSYSARYLQVSNNFFFDNDEGVVFEQSDYSLISDNSFNSSRRVSISLISQANYITIESNEIICSGNYSIFISQYCSDNSIYDNIFIDNNLDGSSQACDNGASNLWYNDVTLTGNYWSDYSGTGGYLIDGTANAVDLYPYADTTLMELPQNAIVYFAFAGLMVIVLRRKKK